MTKVLRLYRIILLVVGWRLHLPPVPFWGDTAFCIIGGAGILLGMGAATKGVKDDSGT